jgi:hypothetical protein
MLLEHTIEEFNLWMMMSIDYRRCLEHDIIGYIGLTMQHTESLKIIHFMPTKTFMLSC